ncbi:hypothetical protein CJU78_16560 [Pseudomonas fragi]|nr:hypothetical protein CJU78_16560 [Pseudomonas fragi]
MLGHAHAPGNAQCTEPASCPAIGRTHTPCGSGLARDSGYAVCQAHRGDTIASKPAPTTRLP